MFVKAGMNVLLLGSRGTGKSATIRTALHCRKLQDYQIAKIFATNTSSAGKIQVKQTSEFHFVKHASIEANVSPTSEEAAIHIRSTFWKSTYCILHRRYKYVSLRLC